MKKIILILVGVFLIINKAVSQTYTYDNNHQITQIRYDNGIIATIQYDANGNRISYIVSGAVLPLTLLSFNAKKSGNQVLLTWTTSEEINTDRFEVEYSKDGVVFSSFKTVPAMGNSTVRNDYSNIHCCPKEGINYYRLKMIDRDGKFKYSEVRKVEYEFINVMKLHPNPTTDKTVLNVSFLRGFNQDAIISVYNSNGALVHSLIMSKGETQTSVNTTKLSAGSYYVVVRVGEELYKEAFVKQ